ncbi:uncharacterized protein LOC111365692 [Olea europaea var. sylvestris]|uniref:uncharacterized protein LOC111365692 n=1 Tax=Olea europaea var. sylvestris TaxID=158386 RepID=UPI000C1D66D9|nr:uncharacterized protein LOC111365692 [Olea europaea var. sylvestris]
MKLTLRDKIVAAQKNDPFLEKRFEIVEDKTLMGSIALFVSKCMVCQQVKVEHQRSSGPLNPMDIPELKWEKIAMWVFLDHSDNLYLEQFVQIYIREIMRLYGVSVSIVSDREPRQFERIIQVLEDMLKACVLDLGGKWKDHLPFVEFAYNNSFQAIIGMAPYMRLCMVVNVVHHYTGTKLSYANKRRKELTFEVGEKVFLKVAPMKGILRFGKKGKLSPRFIGPFEILEKIGNVAYRLALPLKLSAVHVFHVSILRKYISNPNHVVMFDH